MKTLDVLKKSFRNMILLGTMIVNLFSVTWLSAQQTMSLGNLQFVLPDESATMASRTIRMRMGGTDNINSLFYNIVGGIAFCQQAIPDLAVKNIDVYYSSRDNKAHLSINGKNIIIPIEMFELQPIVNFTNSDDNVLMTMYGGQYGFYNNTEAQQILFHPAFIDNMMGLRLLQVDAMTPLNGTNGYFPVYEGDTFCLTNSEFERYTKLNNQLEANGNSYIENAQIAYQEIKPENISSYIYTDINQPIHFSIANNNIVFHGLPYYQFSTITENEVDPLSYYYYYKSLCNYIEKMTPQVIDEELEPYKEYYSDEEISDMKELMLMCKELINPYCGTLEIIDGQSDKTEEQKAVEFFAIIQGENGELSGLFNSYLALLFPMQVSADDITNNLRDKPELVRNLNPIVYQEVDDICQWSALFRYIKVKNPSAWAKFVSQVNSATPEGPAVRTPIRLLEQLY